MQPAKITVDRHTFHNATHLAHAQSFVRSAYKLKRLVSTSLTMEVPVISGYHVRPLHQFQNDKAEYLQFSHNNDRCVLQRWTLAIK